MGTTAHRHKNFCMSTIRGDAAVFLMQHLNDQHDLGTGKSPGIRGRYGIMQHYRRRARLARSGSA